MDISCYFYPFLLLKLVVNICFNLDNKYWKIQVIAFRVFNISECLLCDYEVVRSVLHTELFTQHRLYFELQWMVNNLSVYVVNVVV
jgi:hypothetical protein